MRMAKHSTAPPTAAGAWSAPSAVATTMPPRADQRGDRVQVAVQHGGDLADQDVAQRATADPGDRADDDRLRRAHPELEGLPGAGDGEQAEARGVQHGDGRVQPF